LNRSAVILAAGVLIAVMPFDELNIAEKGQKAADIPMRSAIGVGLDAKLSFGTSNVVIVAADDHSLLEAIAAISTKDDRKTEDMLKSGKVFSVEPNTRVRILDLAGGKAKVKIVEGGNAFREGWVLDGWLK
jgi:hypothetical protein